MQKSYISGLKIIFQLADHYKKSRKERCSMWRPGFAEILIVLVIVILLFGPGRISKIAKELGASISAFKEGLNNENKDNKIEQASVEEEKKE